jgi:amino acid transporter
VAVSHGSRRTADARVDGSVGTVADASSRADRRPDGRPIGLWAFTGVAVTSFGGPLALAALIAPGIVADASASAGLAMLAAVVVFTVPLVIWLRYSQHVNGAGGLYAFVEAAAGRRVALVQAAIWIVSYVLYLVYTTVQIVYDLLPAVLPGERRYQTLLALLIPVTLAAVMIAGRRAMLLATGVMAAGQLALAGALGGVTIAHISTPASSFAAGAPAGSLAKSTAQTSLLYICGSLPLFLGGEVRRPVRTIRRGLIGAYLASAVVVVAAVAPLAAAPGLLHTAVPGVSVAQQFAGPGFANVLGIGIAVSVGGVMLAEYVALSRLVHAISSWRVRPITVGIGVLIVAAAPFMLIDPQGFDDALVKPSLVALWLSQLIVFAVFPRFARKHGQRTLPAWLLSVAASAFAIYGLWVTLHHGAS